MRTTVTFILFLLLAGCGPKATIVKSPIFIPAPSDQVILVLPVTSIMCPQDVSETFFDHLIDRLNQLGAPYGYLFSILKQSREDLPEGALDDRYYATGEIYGCLEDIGATTAEVLMTMRIELYQPWLNEPTLRLRYPVERFYELEVATPPEARQSLAYDTAEQAANDLIEALQSSN